MDTRKSSATRAPVDEKARLARLEEKYRHELMDYEERCEIWSRIAKARAEIAKAKASQGT
jgi:hypothetical protein